MLKLKASFAKKVPAETEYSSQSYHCEVECEVPDGLTAQQLNDKVHNVYQFVRNAVENELSGTNRNVPQQFQQIQQQPVQPAMPVQQNRVNYNQTQPQSSDRKSHGRPASSKQLNYLLSLAQRAGWTIQQILQKCHVASVEQIPSRLCSQLIEEFSGAAA